MKNLINKIKELKKNKKLMSLIKQKLKEFASNKNYFSELCFCLLTANASAESGIKCQKALDKKFGILNERKLSQELKKLHYRFPNRRAHFIHQAQSRCNLLKEIKSMPSKEARNFLVENFKGLGMKEASHFLRNIGRKDVAIIDRHILRSLGLKINSLTHKKYLKIENKLKQIAHYTGTNLAELDLMLWYTQTGKVLK